MGCRNGMGVLQAQGVWDVGMGWGVAGTGSMGCRNGMGVLQAQGVWDDPGLRMQAQGVCCFICCVIIFF